MEENHHCYYIPKFTNFTITTTIITTTTIIIIFSTIFFILRRFLGGRRHRLRAFTFKPNPKNKETLYCAVCLHNVAGGERCRKLPKCNHCFHVDCIDPWFETRSTCPLCRTIVHHLPTKKQKQKTVFSWFLWFSHLILRKIGNLVVDGITKAFLEDS
ncbi:hypothetical protein ACSBR2_017111 [Camellia fascicularis]